MKKTLLAAVIILASALPAVTTEATTASTLTTYPDTRYQNIDAYTNITLGMAERERKEQEAWDREKKRRGKEYESDKQERRDRERWERQEEKNVQRRTATIKKTRNVKTTVILNASANGSSTLPNREEKATDSRH